MRRGKVPILLANVLKFFRSVVEDLDVAGKISVAIYLGKLGKGVVCNTCKI